MDDQQRWLTAELAADLGAAIQAMSGAAPKVRTTEDSCVESAPRVLWRQQFNASEGAAYLAASAGTWIRVGERILRAAGLEPEDEPLSRNTFAEVVTQAFARLAQAMGRHTGTDWTTTEGGEAADDQTTQQRWNRIDLAFGDGTGEIVLTAFDAALIKDLRPTGTVRPAALVTGTVGTPTVPADPDRAKNLDLLLDVELPVSVSFGRALLPLKDVVKLTTGCIVELNRTIAEPVEVIVNNCVIARGEVVVIEGNFGVRILEVVSREMRLRSLP